MIKPYKKIKERIKEFKTEIEEWIKQEEINAKKEKREPCYPAIDVRDLEMRLGFDASDKKDWMPRHIKDKMREEGINLRKGHGYTLIKIILSDEPVNKFGNENAKGQRKDL